LREGYSEGLHTPEENDMDAVQEKLKEIAV
jgi:hypothetical protein